MISRILLFSLNGGLPLQSQKCSLLTQLHSSRLLFSFNCIILGCLLLLVIRLCSDSLVVSCIKLHSLIDVVRVFIPFHFHSLGQFSIYKWTWKGFCLRILHFFIRPQVFFNSYRFYVLPNLDGYRVCVLVYLLFYLLYYNDLVISSVSTYSYFFILLILIHYSLFISANRKALLKEFLNLVLIPILEHSDDRLREK